MRLFSDAQVNSALQYVTLLECSFKYNLKMTLAHQYRVLRANSTVSPWITVNTIEHIIDSVVKNWKRVI